MLVDPPGKLLGILGGLESGATVLLQSIQGTESDACLRQGSLKFACFLISYKDMAEIVKLLEPRQMRFADKGQQTRSCDTNRTDTRGKAEDQNSLAVFTPDSRRRRGSFNRHFPAPQ